MASDSSSATWLGWRRPFILIGLGMDSLGVWIMGMANMVNGLTIGHAVTNPSAGARAVGHGIQRVVPTPKGHQSRCAARAVQLNRSGAGDLGIGALDNLGGYSLPFFVATSIAALYIITMAPIGEIRRTPARAFGGWHWPPRRAT